MRAVPTHLVLGCLVFVFMVEMIDSVVDGFVDIYW